MDKYREMKHLIKENFTEDIICLFCDKIKINPLKCSSCSISLCSYCSPKSTCPYCQSPLTPDKETSDLLTKLKFFCQNGCNSLISFDDLNNHYTSTCPFLKNKGVNYKVEIENLKINIDIIKNNIEDLKKNQYEVRANKEILNEAMDQYNIYKFENEKKLKVLEDKKMKLCIEKMKLLDQLEYLDKHNDIDEEYKKIEERYNDQLNNGSIINNNYNNISNNNINININNNNAHDNSNGIKNKFDKFIKKINEPWLNKIHGTNNNEVKDVNNILNSSKIIKKAEIHTLKSWIESALKKTIIKCDKIFNSDINRDNSLVFHNLCDNKPNLLILILSKNNKRFGVFMSTPIKLLSSLVNEAYAIDSKAFLFNLDNRMTFKDSTMTFKRKDCKDSIVCFGEGQKIFKINDKFLSMRSEGNPDINLITGSKYFIVDVLEVYEIFTK